MRHRFFAILSCVLLFTQIINAQYKYSIRLELPTQFESDTVNFDINNTLENKSYKKIIKKGSVTFTGTTQAKYSSAYIYFTKNSILIDTSFYFGNKPVKIVCQKKKLSVNPFLNSSFINVCFQQITKGMEDSLFAEQKASKTAYLDFRNSNNPNKDSLKCIFLEKKIKYENKLLQFIKNNKNSYFSLAFFNSYFVKRADYSNSDSLLRFFQSTFSKEFIISKEGRFIKKTLISKNQIIEGVYAPSFTSIDFYGNKKSFNCIDSVKKYTLLQFWASWCAPCIREIPAIKNIRNKFSEKDLRIISVSIDIDSNKWISGVNKYKLDWENFNDLNIQKKYGVSAIPAIYLISPKGVIVYASEQSGDNELLENLNSLLKKLL